jgi:hypothetical protein
MTAVNASWQGAAAYTEPGGSAVDASWDFGWYVPPAGDSADFTFWAAGAYTPPAGNEADFSFEEAAANQTSVASGFTSSALGEPVAIWETLASASALEPGANIPSPRYTVIARATGLGPVSRVPGAYFAFNQTLLATGRQFTTRFGAGYVFIPFQFGPENIVVQAAGLGATLFGSADFVGQVTLTATGSEFGSFGVSRSGRGQSASGFALASFGQPAAKVTGRVAGFQTINIPAPQGYNHRTVQSISPVVRFGSHKTFRPNVYRAYPLSSTRMGRPSGRTFFGRYVTGWAAAVLGEPMGYSALKARMRGPETSLGRPLVRRTPTC